MKEMSSMALRSTGGKLLVLDQTLLPGEERWLECESIDAMVEIIHSLRTRGAPLIGVAAVAALAQLAEKEEKPEALADAARKLRKARPTAVNLMIAIDRAVPPGTTANAAHIIKTAEAMWDEDIALCRRIANAGAELVRDGDGIITHCNTGGLATAGMGTALGVIQRAHEQGKRIHVYVDETRPLLQGGRLTAWELYKLGIPHTLICDNMAAILMAQKKVRLAFVGADRIATNGDFANKVGTYSLAVNAHHHGVEFYSCAPYTTIDFQCPDGTQIPIEQRPEREVRGAAGAFGEVQWSPPSPVFNPAFDVTPVDLVSGIVTDKGLFTRQQLKQGILTTLNR
jgi:methylthioribose-1-phosphate isomerase